MRKLVRRIVFLQKAGVGLGGSEGEICMLRAPILLFGLREAKFHRKKKKGEYIFCEKSEKSKTPDLGWRMSVGPHLLAALHAMFGDDLSP